VDMSEELRNDGLLLSGHDPGWVTLQELLDFDWEGKTILRTGVVDAASVHPFGDGKRKFPKGVYQVAHSAPGPKVTWVDTYKEAVGTDFLVKLLDTLGRFGSPEAVRIVFSFDSQSWVHQPDQMNERSNWPIRASSRSIMANDTSCQLATPPPPRDVHTSHS
jgi:hypothetical protein